MNIKYQSYKFLLFDWGDTLMRDFKDKEGPMYYWDEVVLIEGVEDFLQYCSERYTLAVATNAGCSDTNLMIKALFRGGIAQYFSHFFSSKELGVEKPNPAFFKIIAKQLNILPSDVIVIGNDYVKDIQSSKKSGFTTFFFNEHDKSGVFSDADLVFSSFSELYAVL